MRLRRRQVRVQPSREPQRWIVTTSAVALAAIVSAAVALAGEPPRDSANETEASASSEPAREWDDAKRVSVEVARERAKLVHNIYSTTLDVIHRQYFREDRTTVPSRAMEDVFPKIADQENVGAKWISVNAKAMSIDHEPAEGFEKQAAKAIAAGKGVYEGVEEGIYRRAEGISLMNKGCLDCHLGFGASGRTKRFAGLVITIPVTKD